MKNEDHSCLLRRLTLCDGQVVPEPRPGRALARCYCVRLLEEVDRGREIRASAIRHTRARVVAQAAELERIRTQRQNWSTSEF